MQLKTTLNRLQSELDLVKKEAKMLRAELDARNSHIQRLEDENRQWKERNNQLLTKVCPSLYFAIRNINLQ